MSALLSVKGISDHEIAYNPAVILEGHHKIIAVRIEDRLSDWQNPDTYDPHIMFFQREKDLLKLVPNTPVFVKYEDPWATWITLPHSVPQLLFGAVWVDQSTTPPTVTTRVFLSPSVSQLDPYSPIAEIRGMKDIRICQMSSGRFAVFTRPAFEDMFFGRVGFTVISDLSELSGSIPQAQLLKFDMPSEGKIGVNEVFYVDGHIHGFCHVATRDADSTLHYTAYQFDLNPLDPFQSLIPLHLVCRRSDFPPSPPKSANLSDVVFPGGIGKMGQTDFYCGLSDSAVGVISLP